MGCPVKSDICIRWSCDSAQLSLALPRASCHVEAPGLGSAARWVYSALALRSLGTFLTHAFAIRPRGSLCKICGGNLRWSEVRISSDWEMLSSGLQRDHQHGHLCYMNTGSGRPGSRSPFIGGLGPYIKVPTNLNQEHSNQRQRVKSNSIFYTDHCH